MTNYLLFFFREILKNFLNKIIEFSNFENKNKVNVVKLIINILFSLKILANTIPEKKKQKR